MKTNFTNKLLPFVSVIIPVYNDLKRLEKCLKSLEKQTYFRNLYEVIIVDNNSEEDVENFVKEFSFVCHTCENMPGSYAARNKGISVAKGEVLAFTDSDCIPATDWLTKGVESLLQIPKGGMVAGKIELVFKNQNNPTVVELYDSINFLRQKTYVEELNFGATANLFTLKDVFEVVGLFNTNLKSSGDREWGQRLFKAGYKQVYAEDVCVAHPARAELKEIQTKASRIVEGLYILDNHEKKSLASFFKEVFLDVKPPRKEILSILSNKRLKGINRKYKYICLFLMLRWIGAWKKIQLYTKANQHPEKTS